MRAALALLTTLIAMASAADAQVPRPPVRIGLLVTGPPPVEQQCVSALRRGLSEFHHFEGQTYVFRRDGADLIVSVAGEGIGETKPFVTSVPVVMAVASYPVERGVVRPGGNVTGMATFSGDLYVKRIQLLAQALPEVSTVAVFRVPGAVSDLIVRDFERAARPLRLKAHVLELTGSGTDDIASAFQEAVSARATAVMTTQSPFFHRHRRLIADLALKHKLPSFSSEALAAEAGTLVTHRPSIDDSCHRTASFVDSIVNGVKPADLPIEQPVRFELVINLKTARTLGIAIPASILLRADRVID